VRGASGTPQLRADKRLVRYVARQLYRLLEADPILDTT
jgi:hypothetical protein